MPRCGECYSIGITAIDSQQNPYEPPDPVSDADARPMSSRLFAPKRGPAIVIVSSALLGALAGIPLLMLGQLAGFFGVFPGALFGGFAYLFASSSLPIDPTARARRYKYSAIACGALPALSALGTGMRGQGFHMTIGAALIGFAIALGILISGDRRAAPMR
ncbi:hypothetical protein CKO51_32435 [Rhodopirellula sp. SM50]|nr:hypothetical protein CKO51_32435 [Rhodopirellula sp. SM50]